MYPPEEFPEEAVLPEETEAMPIAEEESLPEEQEEVVPAFSEEDIRGAFQDLLLYARDEDRAIREEHIRLCRRLDYYWNNILDIFLDPVSRDWRVPNWEELEDEGEVAPRLINIYRPHGEAIVAALSVTIPSTIYHPDDADVPEDLEMARACGDIEELLSLHNEAPMLFIKALVVLFNFGTIFGYNYYMEDKKFGTYKKSQIGYQDTETFEAMCPQCGSPLDGGFGGNAQPEYQCPECGYIGPAEVSNQIEKLPQIVGEIDHPKGSVCQDIFSGKFVKVPAYAKKQEECGYLLLEFVQGTALLRSIFPEHARKIDSKAYTPYDESFSKVPLTYLGEIPDNTSNVSCIWIRPWQFWSLSLDKPELIDHLSKTYSDGCYAIFINDEFIEVQAESMDDHWTISKNPLGEFIYARPLGENLSTLQDIRAQLVEIELQTAEHGIPETFADSKVLDFQKYGEGRSKPGMMTPVKPRAGKSIGDAFFTTKTAILSQEIDPLRKHIDQDAQFVVGSFPSVYGGPATGGSQTASEYSQSRAVALQRLGTIWKIVTAFWSQFQSRSVIEYANILKESGRDERFTRKQDNSYVNVWIRNTSLTGKVGHVEPESSEQLPAAWAQKKDAIQQLLMAGVEPILEVLTHPRNANVMKTAIGLKELYVPGEEDRMRQYKEFSLLSQGIPVPTNPQYDNEEIHIEVLQSILEGYMGDTLTEEGRNACMIHLMEHQQSIAMQQQAMMQQEMEMQAAGKAPAEKSGKQPPAKEKNNAE